VVFEPGRFDPALIKSLQDKDYNIKEEYSRIIGRVDAIQISDSGEITTGADPRGDDTAVPLF